MNRRRLLLLSILGTLAACTQAPPPALDTAGMKTAIEKEEAKFPDLFKTKDPAALAALYEEDATWILPDGTVFVGRPAITEGAKAFFGSFESATVQPAVTDAFFAIDSANAVMFAHMNYSVRMKGAKKDEDHINYFSTHWHKGADGMWRAHHDLNVDATVKPPAPAKAPAKEPAKAPAKAPAKTPTKAPAKKAATKAGGGGQ